jgi:hypothetical protein
MQLYPNQHPAERTPRPERREGGRRLLDYLGPGGELAILPSGLVLAVQADHLAEVIRLDDLRLALKIC